MYIMHSDYIKLYSSLLLGTNPQSPSQLYVLLIFELMSSDNLRLSTTASMTLQKTKIYDCPALSSHQLPVAIQPGVWPPVKFLHPY